jgi:hypothetical protein
MDIPDESGSVIGAVDSICNPPPVCKFCFLYEESHGRKRNRKQNLPVCLGRGSAPVVSVPCGDQRTIQIEIA